ncbi:MAG: hypothetical protein RR902_03930, partial [Oscillospiraceae bacterium]
MTFSSFRYLVKQGFKNMVANRLMSVASIGVLAACLFVTGAAALLSVNVNRYATYLVGRSEIIVYLWDTEEQRILAADPNAEVGDAVTPVNPDSIKA